MVQQTVRHHQQLRVWQLGMELAVDVYRATVIMPIDERFGLTSQIRRAASSISANIAEGAGRGSSLDFARHVSIASGSLAELESHLELAERLGFLAFEASMHRKMRGLRMMLSSLRTRLRR
jgi:four helix bundle protein